MSLLLVVLLAGGMAAAQSTPYDYSADETASGTPKAVPSFDVTAMDKTANPCNDFYQFACGGWLKANEIPADQSSWGRFNELFERNRAVLHEILEKAAAQKGKRDAVTRKIGDYYASCMDESGIEAKGTAPLKQALARIDAMKSKSDLPATIAWLHARGVRNSFNFGSDQDFKDSTQVIATADQGGMGLPDRDYYFKDDPKSKEQREKYAKHVENIFKLLGDSPQAAAANAKVVMAMETDLAKGALERVKRREPSNIYHKMTTAELMAITPSFDWHKYFVAAGVPGTSSLNVAVPDFEKAFQAAVEAHPLDHWKAYLRWHLARAAAPNLPARFVEENFDFYGRTLSGQKELQARWKRCSIATDRALGEALGQAYVKETFGTEGKARTMKMIAALEKALEQDIKDLPWMTETTKKQALVKLAGIANKIGYPDNWRDYSTLKVVRGEALGNAQRAATFEFKRDLAKIGKPVDKKEWGMTPPTVNAYYNPQMNDINFPAGILQPPFYDNNIDDAVNFGGIGVVIGHELTHGFDDEGRKFDATGNLRDWWSKEDGEEFEKRAKCISDEYSGFVAVKDDKDPKNDVHVNGKLTLGENTADNGGARIAYMALMDTLAGKTPAPKDGYTAEQRFFIGFGQVWCGKLRPEAARLRALNDPHSPGRYRTIGTVSNMPEFQQAFGCKKGDAMVRENACRVW
jgi:endothelin-converting enzyme/putative endopeptidase